MGAEVGVEVGTAVEEAVGGVVDVEDDEDTDTNV